MHRRLFITAATLAITTLLPASVAAWWTGPGGAYPAYYGVTPAQAMGRGGFNFNSSFRSRGYGNSAHRYYGYRGQQPYPRVHPTAAAWIIRGVNFKYDSAELSPRSLQILDNVAATLRYIPAQELEVGGHASAEGDTPYNLELSRRRAQTVRAYLLTRGVKQNHLSYRGYGETRPLVANTSEAGRQLNRRVELTPASARYNGALPANVMTGQRW